MNIWAVLKSFLKINYPTGSEFFSSLKDEYINEKDYFHATMFGIRLN